MFNRLCQHLGHLFLLLLIAQGLVMSGIGETRAHGPVDAVAVEHNLQEELQIMHGHAHRHVHASTDRQPLSHDGGSHFHETADRIMDRIVMALLPPSTIRQQQRDGSPLRRAFRLERPPRPVMAA
ncbi:MULTISPECIES: hypothetical protein [Halomonas]|uniref:hypothetical protein n=1 Tax=Halomonas TaxID=2745 RepID=UPI001C973E9E|nr:MULTISPECIES: hypothetical protein [Halomonas]MBY5926319.1 hypothetical protein [Halomonas sp. DP4Y7-2]MBY6209732.1 hypothetical protein [Halomonas sp. DP3Y7-2]MBY6229951.1 hypothetical protein [Halomonas sp. DP3Y7-1]MBY6233361.1 hypothetical protein [Halomonas sp. DP4Y7-1]MCA0918234.1 hypothetical protein [Halomonas denitrificans]